MHVEVMYALHPTDSSHSISQYISNVSQKRGDKGEPLDNIRSIDDPRNVITLWGELHHHLGNLSIAFLQVCSPSQVYC